MAAGLFRRAQQDLDVHLVVGTVDARRVVDGVGVARALPARAYSTRLLGQPQVRALADHLGAAPRAR